VRHRYLVCYDVCDQKRLRLVYKKMHGFGDPIQYSVFKCDLSAAEYVLLLGALRGLINSREDRVMIVRLGTIEEPAEQRVEFLGRPLAPWDRPGAVVIG
jgi:CRISPR-associated protein Cas2